MMEGYTNELRYPEGSYQDATVESSRDDKNGIYRLEIYTVIRKPHLFYGIKSVQVITIYREIGMIQSSVDPYYTGQTSIGPISVGSIRDKFESQILSHIQNDNKEELLFEVKGETASGFQVMANINYWFKVLLDFKSNQLTLSGAHDGYPSYQVKFDGKIIYDHQQSENTRDLWGESDTILEPISVNIK